MNKKILVLSRLFNREIFARNCESDIGDVCIITLLHNKKHCLQNYMEVLRWRI